MTDVVRALWADIDAQNWPALAGHFAPGATICWHNTRERFTPDEFARANSEYPGRWRVEVERVERCGDGAVSVVRVAQLPEGPSHHAVSFFAFDGAGRIASLDEYWGDDGEPPAWRTEAGIGRHF